MKALIIGNGMVGSALGKALAGLGHGVDYHDPEKGLSAMNPNDYEVAFICVPTPHDGRRSELGHVREALMWLTGRADGCPVVLRSTVPPGTCHELAALFPGLRLVYCPEFLTEATADYDAANPARLIVGTTINTQDLGPEGTAAEVVRLMPKGRACLVGVMAAREAEMVKLFSNGFYALKLAYLNQMYDLAVAHGCDWEAVIQAVRADPMIGGHHLDVWHKGTRGFGGKCLPKDLLALESSMRAAGVPPYMLNFASEYNRVLRGGDVKGGGGS